MIALSELRIKIFADGADMLGMLELYRKPYIKGFTTNPTLMRRAGISDYAAFAREVLATISDRPISFEVFADDEAQMERQAREIASWGENVYVKIPVTNTRGDSTAALVRRLNRDRIKVNVTAIMTMKQVQTIADVVANGTASYISVFAGRIADTGCDPVPMMAQTVEFLRSVPSAELIWASPREILNLMQAEQIGCHIITATGDILKKVDLLGKSLDDYSLETVQMFRTDAIAAGYSL